MRRTLLSYRFQLARGDARRPARLTSRVVNCISSQSGYYRVFDPDSTPTGVTLHSWRNLLGLRQEGVLRIHVHEVTALLLTQASILFTFLHTTIFRQQPFDRNFPSQHPCKAYGLSKALQNAEPRGNRDTPQPLSKNPKVFENTKKKRPPQKTVTKQHKPPKKKSHTPKKKTKREGVIVRKERRGWDRKKKSPPQNAKNNNRYHTPNNTQKKNLPKRQKKNADEHSKTAPEKTPRKPAGKKTPKPTTHTKKHPITPTPKNHREENFSFLR